MEKLTFEIKHDEFQTLFDRLLKNAFDVLCQNQRHGRGYNDNKFVEIIGDAIERQREEIEKALGEYILEIVRSDDFRVAVKAEYTSMLASAMLDNISKNR